MLNNLTSMVSDDMTGTLVNTLFHSFWQISLIALVANMILKTAHQRSPQWRYHLLLISLGLSLILSFGTFMHLLGSEENPTVVFSFAQVNSLGISSIDYPISWWDHVSTWIGAHQNLILQIWLLGLLLFSLKFLFSIIYIRFLSSHFSLLISSDIRSIYSNLSSKLKLTKQFTLGESPYVASPMLLGFFKPMILFPIGLVNQLNSNEIEAILAHELSHYLRKDLLVNFIQSCIETLFYYHPAIWWISNQIRQERENCCDDDAINLVGNHIEYAKTLVKVQELQLAFQPTLGMNFNKNSFFSNRIKRILKMTQTRNYLKTKLFVSTILVVLVMFLAKNVIGHNSKLENSSLLISKNIEVNDMPMTNDSLPQRKESISIHKKTNDQDVKISMEDGKVTDLEINGKKIDQNDYDQYQDIISEVQPSNPGDGQMRMFFFGDDGHNFGSSQNGVLDVDSIIAQLNFKNGFPNLGDMSYDSEMLNKSMKQLQDQLGSMNFNFGHLQGLDSMDWNQFNFTFPNSNGNDQDSNHPFFQFEDEGSFEFPNALEMKEIDGINTNDSPNSKEVVGNALNRDGFLIPGQENKVELTGRYLKINGEKQPTNIWQKYKRIFEEQTGVVLEKNSRLAFSILGKESKRKYKVY